MNKAKKKIRKNIYENESNGSNERRYGARYAKGDIQSCDSDETIEDKEYLIYKKLQDELARMGQTPNQIRIQESK